MSMMETKSIYSGNEQLCAFDECPDYMQFNEFIRTGYRVNFSLRSCVQSIFMWTNETMNIWTHLIGVILFCYYIIHINKDVLPAYEKSNMADHMIMSLFTFCFLMCLLFSACFHIFCCHSKLFYNKCLRYDLMGITFSLWGCYIPSIYYGFYCHKLWQSFYTVSVLIMMLMVMAFQYCPRRVYTQKTDYKRIVFFCVLCLFGIVPAIHWVYLVGGFENVLVQYLIPRIIVMYILGAIAFGFYITKLPEKYFPGRFDFIGASHQLWHTLVLCAFVWWYYSSLLLIKVRLGDEDSCLLELGKKVGVDHS